MNYYEKRLNQSPKLFAPIADAVKIGQAALTSISANACLFYDNFADCYLSIADSANALVDLLSKKFTRLKVENSKPVAQTADDKKSISLCAYDVDDESAYKNLLKPVWITPCFLAYYDKTAPIDFDFSPFNIRKLDKSFAQFVLDTYSLKIFHRIEEVLFHIESIGMYGAFDGDKIMGYIGRHPEGSIGLLEVMNEYQRQGVGTALEYYMANVLISQNLTPYGHIVNTNNRSLALQKKIDFVITSERVNWYGLNLSLIL